MSSAVRLLPPLTSGILIASGCALHAGQRLSGGGWRARRSDSIHPLRLSSPMIAHVLANEEQAGGSRAAGICPPVVKQVGVTCHLMHADFPCACFYTLE